MRQYLDLGAWVFLFALLPITVLILLSQNTIPGDFFYPVKRGMENIVLVASAVSPSTRAAFRTDLTQRRFDEASQILVSKADVSAYYDFVTEVRQAKQDIETISDPKEKSAKSEALLAKIEQYQTQLTQVQSQIQQAEVFQAPQIPSQNSQPLPSETPAGTPQPSKTPATTPVQAPTPTSTPVASPAQTPLVTSTPAPSSSVPLTPPLNPSAITIIVNNPQKRQDLNQQIGNIHDEIGEIGRELQVQTTEKNKKDKRDNNKQE